MPQVTVTFEHSLGDWVRLKVDGQRAIVVEQIVETSGLRKFCCAYQLNGCVHSPNLTANQLKPWTAEHESEES